MPAWILTEKIRGNHAVIETDWIRGRDGSKIVAGPMKPVELGDDDPGTCMVEPEAVLGRSGDLNRGAGGARRRVRDRGHEYDGVAVLLERLRVR